MGSVTRALLKWSVVWSGKSLIFKDLLLAGCRSRANPKVINKMTSSP
jgi:hypothetical protein